MSVIEDSRKILQDFIAPELRAIDARLVSLEKRFDEAQARTDKRFDAVDKRFDEVEQRIDKRFDQVMAEIRRLADIHDLQIRMTRLESQANVSAARSSAPTTSEAA